MGRAPCCDKANVKKGPWSPEEDAKLKSHIEKHGTGGNWIALPQKIGLKRCGKSCRLRWLNYLRPNIKHGGFTENEDKLICSLYVSIGSRWSIIAAQLPGRTDNDIKNYWNTRLKKKLLGKQRREQQTRWNSRGNKQFGTQKGCGQSYPRSQQPAAPPLLVGYTNENRPHQPAASYSVTHSLLLPQIESSFSYDHTQLNNQEKFVETFHCISDVSKNSTCTDLMYCSGSDIHINLPAISGVPQDGLYGSMPQLLDGLDGFSAIDIVNSSTISSSSLENTSWGDTSPIFYTSTLTNYDVRHQEMPQDWTLFDELNY